MATTSRSLHSLAGDWTMSRSLSSDMSPVLAMQGINFVMRRAAAAAPVYWAVSQPSDNELVVDQTTIGSLPANKEEWIHDWQARDYKMGFIGTVSRRSRWVKAGEAAEGDAFLIEGLSPDEEVIEEEMNSAAGGWTARYVWRLDGDKLVRRLVIQKGKERKEAKLIYEAKL